MRNTFKAYERLKREQHIDTLFRKGKAFSVFPLRAVYITVPRGEELSPVQVGFSIPKKRFRLSVKRHRVRRLMAEAWRMHKQLLYPTIPADIQLHVFLIFTGDSLPDYATVEKAVIQCMEKLAEIHSKKEADA